jgi:magnesium and cobalt transporter
MDLVLTPVNRVLGLIARLLSRRGTVELPVTEDDLLFMARLAHRHAGLARDARFMIERVVRFQQAMAREIMVPRPRAATVDLSWDLETLQSFIIKSGHSRFPVVEGSPDDIVGVLHAKHLLQLDRSQSWTDALVPPLFIPETKPLPSLLHDFRTTGQHLAIVLDEYGGFSGVVTLEDTLELVVGEIEDEFDQDRIAPIVVLPGGWSVPGHLSLRRLEVLMQRPIRQPVEIDSVGGLAAHLLGDSLGPGATTEWDEIRLKVEEVDEGRPQRVAVQLKR